MQAIITFVAFEVRGEFVMFGDVVDLVSDATDCPPLDVPKFRGGKSEGIKVVVYPLLVPDGHGVGADDDLFRHT